LNNTTRSSLIAIGDSALYNNGIGATQTYQGTQNTAIGSRALRYTSTGYSNSGFGYRALYHNTTGFKNTGIGITPLLANTTGYHNTAVGNRPLYKNTSGHHNVAIGSEVMFENTSGIRNVAVGNYALDANTTGSYNTGVGYSANGSAAALSNSTGLGYNTSPTVSNRVYIGNTSVGWIGGQVAWATYSDARVKQNVLEDVHGLDFILNLRPVSYQYDIDKEQLLMTGQVDQNEWEGEI